MVRAETKEEEPTVCTVQRLQRTARLIQEVLTMVVGQVLGPDHAMQVGLEKFLHQVHYEVSFASCSNILDGVRQG